jgi:hypothetical protein
MKLKRLIVGTVAGASMFGGGALVADNQITTFPEFDAKMATILMSWKWGNK